MNSIVAQKLIDRANQVATTAELMLAKVQDWQKIKEYLCNRVNDETFLSDVQKQKLKRYQFMYNQLAGGKYTDTEVVNASMKMFNIKSHAAAYEDLACTREIFTSVLNINKQFEIMLQLQINRDMQRKAAELNDLKSLAALEKNRALLLKLVPDHEETPAEHFEGHTYELTFDPRLLGAPDVDMNEVLKLINEKRKVKINVDLFEPVEFTETNAEQNTP